MFVIHFLKNGEYKNEREHNVLKSLDHEKDFSKVVSWGCIRIDSAFRQGQADAQTETAQVAKEQRSADGLRLMSMLSEQDFENALSLLDTLHARYPDDPQFHFAEGWIYDMEDDSIKSRRCFEKALMLYDSLVIQDDGVDGKINRAFIIQILYGEDAYNEEITKIAQSARTPEDSANIENWRGVLYDKDKKDIFNLHVY